MNPVILKVTMNPVILKVTNIDVHNNYDRKGESQKRFTHLYVNLDGETVLQNFSNRRSRPVGHYRIVALTALTMLGIDTERVKLSWNQKAGCSMCPCSPGFIVKFDEPSSLLPLHKDVYVTVRVSLACEEVSIRYVEG